MKIALIGYGKMGKTIEKVAKARGHKIVLIIHAENSDELNPGNLEKVDVAIEFTEAKSALKNVEICLKAKTPVVSGTTGWNTHLKKAEQTALKNDAAFLQASNFSVGVNIFFEMNKKLAELMNGHSEYTVEIEETHHTEKKDAPSGTAITLAEQIIEILPEKNEWSLGPSKLRSEIPINSLRVDKVPGTHVVTYASKIDDISISHVAHNREGFALGAVLAAEFIKGKTGVFSMRDVLSI